MALLIETNEKGSEDEMSEQMSRARLDEIKARHEQTEEDGPPGNLAHLHRGALLAEIERAWGEIERREEREGAWHEATQCAGPDDAVTVHNRLIAQTAIAVRRLLHAHDSASALYRAASALGPVVESTPFDLHRATHEQSKAFIGAIDALRAAIDPALTAAALAEMQRRDGLDEQVRTLTADRDEWRRVAEEQAAMLLVRGPALCPKRTNAEHMTRDGSGVCIFCGADTTPPPEMATTTGDLCMVARNVGIALAFLRWVCGMVPVERCRCGAPATITDCTTLGEHGAFYCAAHLGECDMRGTWIATGKRVWTDRGEAVSQ